MPQELAPLVSSLLLTRAVVPGLARPYFGQVQNRQVLAAAGGMGGSRAVAAADAIIREWKPDLLVMAGVAGALATDLAVGEVVVACRVVTPQREWTPPRVPTGARTGSILSLNQVLVTPDEKRTELQRHPGVIAVEMETAAVAGAAEQYGVAWAAVRAVSDTAEESLPLDFNRLRTVEGDLPVSRVALAAVTRPSTIPGLLRLGRNTSTASQALARFFADWLAT